jgi:hypothetical protein
MDASDTTPTEGQESTASETRIDENGLFSEEMGAAALAGRVFIEPSGAAVKVEMRGEELVAVCVRESGNSRGASMQLCLTPDEAAQLVEEIEATVPAVT